MIDKIARLHLKDHVLLTVACIDCSLSVRTLDLFNHNAQSEVKSLRLMVLPPLARDAVS